MNEGYELAMEIGMINRAMMPLAVLAYVNAIHGDHDKAWSQANEVLELSTRAVWRCRSPARSTSRQCST